MMAKDKEMEEARLSNNIGQVGHAQASSGEVDPRGVQKELGRSWGGLLSGFIAVNLLILGCVLASGSAFNYVDISPADLQIYLIILIVFTIGWMLYYSFFTCKKENAVFYKDEHAGPVWLRAGLVVFGIVSLIMDIFKIANYAGYLHCESATPVIFPVVQFIFILVQTCFLWSHAKDCVQLQRNISCCGMMLTLSTNLVLWMLAITEESAHQTILPDSNATRSSGRESFIDRAKYGEEHCKCSYSSCDIFKTAYYYLYPFNIEYSLFASAMTYVMWKNAGRVAVQHNHHFQKFHISDAVLGFTAGIALVVAGLATFIMYEAQVSSGNSVMKDRVLMMYFTMNIVIVSLMAIATVVGCAIYKLDQRDHVSMKNPSRNLDVGLLVVSSLGQFIISYFSIVAMVASNAQGYLNGLDLSLAILNVVQIGVQNMFIVEGLHREPYHETDPFTVFVNPYVLQVSKVLESLDGSHMDQGTKCSPVPTTRVEHAGKTNGVGLHAPGHRSRLTWKRRVLKELCMFLLLGNIILWIMPAFGARPQFDHTTETDFYHVAIWAAIVNIGLPFGIFYRMHSVASLFEVFVAS